MGRPKEFDTEQALDEAMHVFWSKGYEATSVADLTGAMHLSKSGFYETFGSKHDLFLASIERYYRTVTAQVTSAAQLDAPAAKIIRAMFVRAVDRVTDPETRRGCFLNNCAVEVAIHDEEAAKRVAEGLLIVEETFADLVRKGQRDGTVGVRHDVQSLARFLTVNMNGLLVLGKARPDRDFLMDSVDVLTAGLE